MKSRWTTYLLLAVAVLVWGGVIWKLFFSASPPPPAALHPVVSAEKSAVADTLRLGYPDPFLKGKSAAVVQRPAVGRPSPAPKPVRRERIQVVHLGTAASGSRRYYLLTVNGQPCEVEQGEMAGVFRVEGADADSVYLAKDGVIYGVKLCE